MSERTPYNEPVEGSGADGRWTEQEGMQPTYPIPGSLPTTPPVTRLSAQPPEQPRQEGEQS